VLGGTVLLGAGGADEPLSAPAGPKHPSPSVARPTAPAHPRVASTQRPSRGGITPRPATQPTTRATEKNVTNTAPASASAARLRSLATLLRDDPAAQRSRAVLSAARTFDQAANELTSGSQTTAAKLVQDALDRLGDAQRGGRWQPTPAESALLTPLGYHPAATTDTADNAEETVRH
jgi:hypothetical protein